MTRPVSIDVIKAGLVARIDELVPALFPNARRQGGEWVMGDIFGAPGTSLSIRRTGHKAGWWKDFAGTAKGDVLDLFAAGKSAGDVKQGIADAISYLNLGGLTPAEAAEAERRARRTAERKAADHARNLEALRRSARGHFFAGQPIAGTMADRYLAGRGLDIRQLGKPPGALRFRPMRCPETSTAEREVLRPCLIAAVNDAATGALVSLHRTFLGQRPDGTIGKAAMQNAKRAYCEYGGGLIPLQRGESGRRLTEARDGETLVLSEGIEDGLAVALALPRLRVAAALSLSNMGAIAPPPAVRQVWIAGQNDTAPDAIRGLDRAVRMLEERGLVVEVVKPPAAVKDWAEWAERLARPQPLEMTA